MGLVCSSATDHFYSFLLSGGEAGGDLVLIQNTQCLRCKRICLALEQLDSRNKRSEVCYSKTFSVLSYDYILFYT